MHLDTLQPASTADTRSSARDADAVWSEFQSAIGVLRARIRGNGASDLVLAELIEDDLRQARIALHEVHEFLDGAIEVLGTPDACAADVIDASNTSAALDACERLESLLPAVRRRLGQVALRLTRR